MKDHRNCQCEDFAADERFISWVKHPNEESNQYWHEYLINHPLTADAINEARELVLRLSQKQHFSTTERDLLWENINDLLPKPQRRLAAIPALRYAAAACLLIFMLSVAISAGWYFFYKDVTVRSGYAHKQTIILPDGSKVILNANSKLTYPRQFSTTSVREVWIEGEAYFDIKHLNNDINKVKSHERFVVHTSNSDVEVLGTSFTVLHRRNDIKVALIEGSIQLKLDKVPGKLRMVPGESVEYGSNTGEYKKGNDQTAVAVAWLQNKIVLTNTPLTELAQKVKDIYGIDVKIEGGALNNERITGELPSNNLALLIEALRQALNVNVVKDGNKITIKAL
ncbi:hypothetical protein DJ568_16130 [Mucilaginibacter hurinus]|uniref:FecR protein domain-containing protein n=1 Tax=Mucilaginibacter hurinus TaxID=2201324 RepID=A0A367GL82_9SPHI|nr:FecR domain-containing protein [Mucilaginibacter hurinus]RCH53765.1 hypothetical protein DJ568_16130 [Mucilaginibacter hurinus]